MSEQKAIIRRNADGSIDTVDVQGCDVHLEQLRAGLWSLGLDVGGQHLLLEFSTPANEANPDDDGVPIELVVIEDTLGCLDQTEPVA